MSDPDKGLWHYKYNHFGEMTCQTNGNGQHILSSYDRRGRLFNRRDATGGTCDNPSGITSDTTWEYDTAANGYGQPSLIEDSESDYEEQLYYDDFGRVQKKRKKIPGVGNQLQNHYEKVTYDQYGRVFQEFDAARSGDNYSDNAIQYEYKNGFLESIVDAVHIDDSPRETYYLLSDVDAGGQLLQAFHGEHLERTVEYEEDTGRIDNLKTMNGHINPVQDLSLVWDEVGNLTRRTENGSGSGYYERDLIEGYEYDDINQLEEWWGTGLYAVRENVTYSGGGNITSKTGVGAYKYGGQCEGSNAGPHAVCEVDGVTYYYDDNGNMVSDSSGSVLEYSVFDKPTRITRNGHTTRFAYGPDRSRYKREDSTPGGTTTTLYLGSVEKVYYPDGTSLWRRQIGDIAIERQHFNSSGSETDRDLSYLIKDHLGSVSLIVDESGGITHELYVDPWGQYREREWDPEEDNDVPVPYTPFKVEYREVTQRAYTGHEHLDEVGIIHMNGRIYDPRLARFLQADPIIQDRKDVRSLNRYSYVWNNPMNATDPSGFTREEEQKEAEEDARREKEQRERDAQRAAELDNRRDIGVAAFKAQVAMGNDAFDVSLNGVSANSYSGTGAFFGDALGDAMSWTVINSLESSASCGEGSCLITGKVTSKTIHYSTPIGSSADAQEGNMAGSVALASRAVATGGRVAVPAWVTSPWGAVFLALLPTKMGDGSLPAERPEGAWPADQGAREWDRRNGRGREGRDKFHETKQNSPWPGGKESWSVDPETGEIYDPSGDPYDNLND